MTHRKRCEVERYEQSDVGGWSDKTEMRKSGRRKRSCDPSGVTRDMETWRKPLWMRNEGRGGKVWKKHERPTMTRWSREGFSHPSMQRDTQESWGCVLRVWAARTHARMMPEMPPARRGRMKSYFVSRKASRVLRRLKKQWGREVGW